MIKAAYMIACDEVLADGMNYKTVVCHNRGVFLDEAAARLQACYLNADRVGENGGDIETEEDYYFVVPVAVKS